MIYIEFFDTASIVNICACLTDIPEKVVLIGGDIKPMERYKAYYQRVFRDRGYEIEFEPRKVNRNSIDDIVRVLSEVVTSHSDIAVDLTGGDDLMLVAMGIVKERFKDKNIQLHRFNPRTNSISDCDGDGCTIKNKPLHLTVQEHIRIYGGDVVFGDNPRNSTQTWDMNGEFISDIEKMWSICKKDVHRWNVQMQYHAIADNLRSANDNPLKIKAKGSAITKALREKKYSFDYSPCWEILRELCSAGLITYLNDSENLSVTFKNEQVKRCLISSGRLLEMKVYSTMKGLKNNDGSPLYDVMTGVFIDWDGRTAEDSYDTLNEIDVLATKGVVPVFISCKNGHLSRDFKDELYKFKSVADRFGGQYAKKILITTALDDSQNKDSVAHFRKRAEDMGIRIIDDLTTMSDKEAEKTFRNLWM